jgi:hypothetical protein
MWQCYEVELQSWKWCDKVTKWNCSRESDVTMCQSGTAVVKVMWQCAKVELQSWKWCDNVPKWNCSRKTNVAECDEVKLESWKGGDRKRKVGLQALIRQWSGILQQQKNSLKQCHPVATRTMPLYVQHSAACIHKLNIFIFCRAFRRSVRYINSMSRNYSDVGGL